MRPYDRNADGDLRSRTDIYAEPATEAEWTDPGYCGDGITIGVGCRYCDGSAVGPIETLRSHVA